MIFSVTDEDDGVKWSQAQAAKKLTPVAHWSTAATSAGWQLRWSLNGMQPVRPVVLVTAPIDLETGKIFALQNA